MLATELKAEYQLLLFLNEMSSKFSVCVQACVCVHVVPVCACLCVCKPVCACVHAWGACVRASLCVCACGACVRVPVCVQACVCVCVHAWGACVRASLCVPTHHAPWEAVANKAGERAERGGLEKLRCSCFESLPEVENLNLCAEGVVFPSGLAFLLRNTACE